MSRESVDDYGSSSDEGDDWEEVPSLAESAEAHKKAISDRIPESGLVITIPQGSSSGSSKPGLSGSKYDPQEMLRLHLNRKMRRRQEVMHKVSLLMGLSRVVLINNMLRSEELRGLALSSLSVYRLQNQPSILNRQYLLQIFNWIRKTYCQSAADIYLGHPRIQLKAKEMPCDDDESLSHLEVRLKEYLGDESIRRDLNRLHQVLVAILLLREAGFDARLINTMQPVTLRPLSGDLLKKPVQPKDSDDDIHDGADDNAEIENDEEENDAAGPSSAKGARKVVKADTDEDEDDEEDEEESYCKKPKKKKKKPQTKSTIPISKYFGCEFWIEIYVPRERCWISLDVTTGKLENDVELEANAPKPMHYVIGIENDGSVKDLTSRYARRWLFDVVGKRVDSDWWEATLRPYRTMATSRNEREDNLLDIVIRDRSHPQNVGDLRNHPLYTAERFLKKIEVIYPSNIQPQGAVKCVPYYFRSSVKTLYSRNQWYREAKTVKLGEQPYKLVKSRPKVTRNNSGAWITTRNDEPLELFGEWQTEQFKPPVAKDGKVPRNDFGNVELFHEKMLPHGTVHLVLPGLARVAKKLDIDCAKAVVGFDYSVVGSTHAIFDGFVVCEEFKEVLLDAWNQEQDEQEKKAEEKRRTRAYRNWRKLYRGVLIKLRLSKRYPLDSSPNLSNGPTFPSTSKTINSSNSSKQSTRRKQDGHQQLAETNFKPPPKKMEKQKPIEAPPTAPPKRQGTEDQQQELGEATQPPAKNRRKQKSDEATNNKSPAKKRGQEEQEEDGCQPPAKKRGKQHKPQELANCDSPLKKREKLERRAKK